MATGLAAAKQWRRPLGAGRGWRARLLRHHLPLATGSTTASVVFVGLVGQGRVSTGLLTTVTGYVAMVLLALSLLIGPANLLLRRRTPVSSSLARDTGTWAAIYVVIHTVVGLLVHGRNPASAWNFIDYFFLPDATPRADSFGLGNWTGLAALVLAVLLLAISNDRAMRELKAARWKDLQRLNYTLFVLTVLHAIFYGVLLRSIDSPFAITFILTVVVVLAGQAIGIRLWRRNRGQSRIPHEARAASSPP
jgi:sulfoxide reductase heme-binding subunit YedZ